MCFILVFKSLESLWQIIDNITSHKALLSEFVSRQVAGKSVQIHTKRTSLRLDVSPCQQCSDDSREHVAASGSSHSRISCGAEEDMSVRQTECRIMPFHDYIPLKSFSQVESLRESFV